jgi:hypothetical protein
MNIRNSILLLLLASGVLDSRAQTVVFERSSPAILDRGVTLPADRLQEKAAEDMGREFLLSVGTSKALARLTIAADRDSLFATMTHSRTSSYWSTLADIKTYRLPSLPLARILVLDGNAVFTYRDKHVYHERALAGGKTGIHLTAQTIDFEVLHFILTEPGPALSPSHYTLEVFLRARPMVSISACVAATRQLLGLTKVASLDVDVRPDAWFMESEHYPALFPFQENITPPNELQFKVAPSATCGYIEKTGLRCSGFGFRP